jgi:hypothetical protein
VRSSQEYDKLGLSVVCLATLLFVLPFFVAPLTFPAYYDDESWTYLPVFEALRGNGFSFAALGANHVLFIVSDVLLWPIVRLSVFSPEITVRLSGTLIGAALLLGVWQLSKRVSRDAAFVAPALLVMVPLAFTTYRYGRVDALALALGIWAAVLAFDRRPVSGALAALAICVGPIMICCVPFCVFMLCRDRNIRQIVLFILFGTLALLPQLIWFIAYREELLAFSQKFMVSSSIAPGRSFLTQLFPLVAGEWTQFSDYMSQLSLSDKVAQSLLIIAPVLLSAYRKRLLCALLVLPVLLCLTFLFRLKNPYYLIFLVPSVVVVAAHGLSLLPRRFAIAATMIALTATAFHLVGGLTQAQSAAGISAFKEAIEPRLPQQAVIFGPAILGGIIHDRPDLRFFTYHALSDRSRWVYPSSCAQLDARFRERIANDPRPTSHRIAAASDTVFLAGVSPFDVMGYLKLIWPNLSPEEGDCILHSPGETVQQIPLRCADGRTCGMATLATRPLVKPVTKIILPQSQ